MCHRKTPMTDTHLRKRRSWGSSQAARKYKSLPAIQQTFSSQREDVFGRPDLHPQSQGGSSLNDSVITAFMVFQHIEYQSFKFDPTPHASKE